MDPDRGYKAKRTAFWRILAKPTTGKTIVGIQVRPSRGHATSAPPHPWNRLKFTKGLTVTSPVLFEARPDSLDVVLNRPAEGNLITNEMGSEIARALRELGPGIKLVRLRGEGANFCKGRQSPQIDREHSTPPGLPHP